MLYDNAKKKLVKVYGPEKVTDDGQTIRADAGECWIEVSRNGRSDSVAVIHAMRKTDKPDGQTDYFPGFYAPTLAQAIEYAASR